MTRKKTNAQRQTNMHHVMNNSKEPTVSCSRESTIQKVKNRKNRSYETPEPIFSDQHKEYNYKMVCVHERNKREVQFLTSSQLVWDDAQLQEKRRKKKFKKLLDFRRELTL